MFLFVFSIFLFICLKMITRLYFHFHFAYRECTMEDWTGKFIIAHLIYKTSSNLCKYHSMRQSLGLT